MASANSGKLFISHSSDDRAFVSKPWKQGRQFEPLGIAAAVEITLYLENQPPLSPKNDASSPVKVVMSAI